MEYKIIFNPAKNILVINSDENVKFEVQNIVEENQQQSTDSMNSRTDHVLKGIRETSNFLCVNEQQMVAMLIQNGILYRNKNARNALAPTSLGIENELVESVKGLSRNGYWYDRAMITPKGINYIKEMMVTKN